MLLYIKLQSWLFFIKRQHHVKAVKFFLSGDKYNLKKYIAMVDIMLDII